MKVLKVLAIVFGVLFLLTGGGLMVGSYIVGKGESALASGMSSAGLEGPVDGKVTAVQSSMVTVKYTDKQGAPHTGQGISVMTVEPKVGDTVPVFYSTDGSDSVVIGDLGGSTLSGVGSGLRTGGIVCLILGGVLTVAGIVGLVLGKKKPQVAAPARGPGYPVNSQGGYPPGPQGQQPGPSGFTGGQPQQQGYPPHRPQQGYPSHPPGYPQQPQQGYPQQQQPPQGYPQQPQQGYPPQQQPPQGYPQQPQQGYPPQQQPPQGSPQS